MKYLIIVLVLVSFGCRPLESSESGVAPIAAPADPELLNMSNVRQIVKRDVAAKSDEVEEYEKFSDTRRIGRRGLNRVDLSIFARDDQLYVKTRFYVRKNGGWKFKFEHLTEKSGQIPIDPEIKDLNGDGYRDLTFVSGSPARGANELRELFIYNPHRNSLVWIKNAGSLPNLEYNPVLKSIDSLHFTGSTTTVFHRLRGNELVEFASVEDADGFRLVHKIDRNGRRRLLRREKRTDNDLNRYTNFNPVR